MGCGPSSCPLPAILQQCSSLAYTSDDDDECDQLQCGEAKTIPESRRDVQVHKTTSTINFYWYINSGKHTKLQERDRFATHASRAYETHTCRGRIDSGAYQVNSGTAQHWSSVNKQRVSSPSPLLISFFYCLPGVTAQLTQLFLYCQKPQAIFYSF